MAAQPVYKLFHARFNEIYRQLSDAERAALDQRDNEALAAVGGKRIVLCESRWYNEQWDGWGVEEFPSVEAVQEYAHRLAEFGWYRYFDGTTQLGTPFGGFVAQPVSRTETPMAAQPIYLLYRLRFNELWYQLPKAEQDRLVQAVGQVLQKVGGKTIILCESRWHDERWDGWGVEEFPGIEAVQEHVRLQREMGWYRYLDSMSMLGTAWQG